MKRSCLFLLFFFLTVCLGLHVFAEPSLPSAAFAVTDNAGILTLTMQLKGDSLCRTQCAAIAYDRRVLSFSEESSDLKPGTAVPLPHSAAVQYFDGWDDVVLPLYLGISADQNTGYLFLYPHRETAVSYDELTAVCAVPFLRKPSAVLSADSLRLLTFEEQQLFSQSAKLTLCTAEKSFSFGSLNGGDTLADPPFTGNTPITGQRTDPGGRIPDAPWDNPFSDVPENAPYYDAVAYVCQAKLFIGSSETTFSPEEPMNRATFATVLCRLAGEEEEVLRTFDPAAESPFGDVASDQWYTPYVGWAARTGLFLGDDIGLFHPDDPVTHEQMYVLIQRFTNEHGYTVKSGEDVSLSSLADAEKISPWAKDGVRFAFANRLLVVDENRTVRPTEPAFRWELATLLHALSHISHI